MSTFSVMVPSYNGASLIRRCYDSVTAQAHRLLEFLLADDCSTLVDIYEKIYQDNRLA